MEITLWHLLDSLLAILLLGLGWAALSGTDLKRGVVLFMAFGLLLSLIWARLRAPDLALAEAAIGAGLSGALLLLALGCGILLGGLAEIVYFMRVKKENADLRRKTRLVSEELKNLRAMPIKER